MIPHLIRVYPRFICVHQRPWIFVETFRLAKPKRARADELGGTPLFRSLAGRVLPEGIEEISETSVVHRWKTLDALIALIA